MNNILILTDFSDNSWNSIKYALALFQNKSCNFYLLNALNLHKERLEDKGDEKPNLEKKKNAINPKIEFEKLINKINSSALKGNHIFIPIIGEKDIIEEARLQIIEKKINLIVIGTNGMSSNGRKNNISPTSEEIITKLKCSILVVPNEASFSSLKEVAFPTDYTYFNEAVLLQNMMNLLNSHKSSTRFVFMAKKNEELNKEQRWNMETLQDYFVNQSHSFHTEINNNLELSIENFIKKNHIDLIVMAAKNLNLFEQILFRPKIKNIRYYFITPFLILH
ncbi:universal stress protein [Lutibacter sp.]|uniref:universal stress protein n=1 Tax=Lutibacter sp. TaxID=1925666 RepID=UPI002733F80C|nr:universal stress protein [Lutibacter sp.]MDP3314351.1 universal stress protein [Lutibacter sp.]